MYFGVRFLNPAWGLALGVHLGSSRVSRARCSGRQAVGSCPVWPAALRSACSALAVGHALQTGRVPRGSGPPLPSTFSRSSSEPLVGASLLSEARSRHVCMFCCPPDTGGHSGCSGQAVCSGLGGLRFRLSGAGSRAGGLPAFVSCPSSRVRCCRGAVLLQLLPASGGLSPSARPQGSAQTGGRGLSGGMNGSSSRPAFPSHTGCLFLPGQYLVLHLLSLRRHPVCSLPARVRVSRQLAAGFPSVDERQPRRGGGNGATCRQKSAAGSAGPRPPSPKLLSFLPLEVVPEVPILVFLAV